jgi:ABC-type anion transport system duplicated permease subunit
MFFSAGVSTKGGAIMLLNLLVNTHKKQSIASSETGFNNKASHQFRHQILESNIDELYKNSRSGLRGVLIFLFASAIAFYFKEQNLAGSLTANIMEQLGSTPPIILINCIFGASTISSLIIIAGKIYYDREPGSTSTHLWFRVFFYPLYFTSAALGEYFNVVFISGLVVLGLQHYNVWNYYMRAIEINTDKCHSIKTYNN